MVFVVKTCMAYFLWEELDSSPSVKPSTMVLTGDIGSLVKHPHEKMVKDIMSNNECGPNRIYQDPRWTLTVLAKKYNTYQPLVIKGCQRF